MLFGEYVLFKAFIDLKSLLIFPKGQLSVRKSDFKGQFSARQLFLILKVSEFIWFFGCQLTSLITMMKRVIS